MILFSMKNHKIWMWNVLIFPLYQHKQINWDERKMKRTRLSGLKLEYLSWNKRSKDPILNHFQLNSGAIQIQRSRTKSWIYAKIKARKMSNILLIHAKYYWMSENDSIERKRNKDIRKRVSSRSQTLLMSMWVSARVCVSALKNRS